MRICYWNPPFRLMEINQAQKTVDDWIAEYGVRYFNELTNTVILMEEVGEVARIIARRYGEQSEKESDTSKDLGEEMADVLFVLICLGPHLWVTEERLLIFGKIVPMPGLLLYKILPGFDVTVRHSYRYVAMAHLCLNGASVYGHKEGQSNK